MNSNKTLVLISPGFAINEEDTTNLPFLQLLIKALNKKFPDWNIVIIAYQYPHTRSTYTWYGNKVISLYAKKGILRKPFELIMLWRVLSKLNKEYNVVGTMSLWIGEHALIAKRFAIRHHKKSICWLIGQDVKKGNVFARLMQTQPYELVAMSDFLANEFYKNYGVMPSRILPNGIDKTLFDNTNPNKDIDIMGAGSLIPLKQYSIFVDVVNAVSKQLPGIKSILCGKGPEEKALRNQVAILQLEDSIEITNEKQHTEVLKLMQRSKVFLHPSSYEGFSTVCLEALYAGAHVISFCKPMHSEIQNWHIVATKEEMAAKAYKLLNDPHTKYQPIEVYKMDDIAQNVLNLFGYQLPENTI